MVIYLCILVLFEGDLIMKSKGFFLYTFDFIVLLLVAEGVNYFLSAKLAIAPYFNVPLVFLAVKYLYDLYNYVFFGERPFSYLEDYIRDIITILFLSILAGGIAYITDIIVKGNVRTTVLAAIAVFYLKKNK